VSKENPPSLGRAVLAAAACLLALSAAAFWPAPRWATPKRPALKAPIVFDELENFRNLAADSSDSTQPP
jgi:hypothetical protein